MKIEIQASGESRGEAIKHLKDLVSDMEQYPLSDEWSSGSDDGYASAVVVKEEEQS